MSGVDRDTTRIVRSWLEEGVTQLPEHLLDAVLDQLPDHHQRRPWWPTRRFPNMSTAMRVVLASVAAVLVVAGGAYLLSRQNVGAPVTSPTPSPTAISTPESTPTPSATPTPAPQDQLPEGEDVPLQPGSYSYYEPLGEGRLRVTLTVPAGWTSHEQWYVHRDPILSDGNAVAVAPWLNANAVSLVFPDPCDRTGVITGTTAAELAAAFAATPMHDGAEPVDITVSGYSGKEIHLSTDPGIDPATCPEEHLSPWNGRWVLPGTEMTLWILDVEGDRLVIDASAESGAGAAKRAELQQVLESIQIEVN